MATNARHRAVAWLTIPAIVLLLLWSVARARAAAFGASAEVVRITGVALDRALAAGARSNLSIEAEVQSGWHINSDHPLDPDFIPTQVKLSTPPGVNPGLVEYPLPDEVAPAFAGGEKLSVFSGAIQFKVPLTVGANFVSSRSAPATVTIDYQACNNIQCLRPKSVSTTVDLVLLGNSGASAASVVSGAGATRDPPGASLARTFSAHGYLFGFIVVLLGGLALNLTPCVYPLIGITVAYFWEESGTPRQLLGLAILYVLGIAVTFSGTGVAAALSGGLFGAALQNPYVLAAIAAVLLALAASSFGFFALRAPQWMARWAGRARPGAVGAFVMGLGMGVIAAPCIGPIVLGLLLMVEQSRSALLGFALFFTLAVGLGLPYVGLALAAGHIRKLPRSGMWLMWVEQLFGFVLVGFALYFLDPLTNGLIMRILPYYGAAVAIFLGFFSPAGRGWRQFVALRSGVGVMGFAALAYMIAVPGTSKSLKFQPYDPSALKAAVVERKPVLLDFSANWCIPCREMQHSTFADGAVIKEAGRFVRLRADLTSEDAGNKAIIKQFKIEGVPTTVLIDSSGKVRMQTVGYIGPREMAEDLRRVD